ncbi:hypothetical protein DPSP01_007241 [Paraphaeosphaeria sporulosa]
MQKLKTQHEIPVKFYFHIDGLDEFDGDHYKVIDIMEALAQLPNFKICVSSRPWNQFKHTIGQSSADSMQLHLFTRKDIENFARDSILTHRDYQRQNVQRQQYEDLVNSIGQRSEGVFLWVRLVVRSSRDGLLNDDPVSLIRKRLEQLPIDLEQFFRHILESVDSVYSERMARTFLSALAAPEPLEIIHYSFLDEEDPYFGWTLKFEPMDPTTVTKRVSETRWRLNGRYKGLLEPSSDEDSSRVTVDFLHRTLRDFLAMPQMRRFLQKRAPQDFDPLKSTVGAKIAVAKFLNPSFEPRHLVDALECTGSCQRTKFELIDHIESLCESRYPSMVHTSMHPSLMLRAAVHYHQDDYIKHRIDNNHLPLDPDWMLLHLSSFAGFALGTFADILLLRPENLHNCHCSVADIVSNKKPRADLIASLFDRGANPNAKVGGYTIWSHFLAALEANINRKFYGTYWQILRMMICHGAIPDAKLSVWSRLSDQTKSLSDAAFVQLLEGFSFLVNHGLKLQLAFWFSMWPQLPANRELHDVVAPFRGLTIAFLRHGTDAAQMLTLPYRDSDGLKSWFQRFVDNLELGHTYFGGFRAHHLLRIFFEHGLDANHPFDGRTIWYRLLSALSFPTYNRYHGELILLFLKYGADPRSEALKNLLEWTNGDELWLPEPERSQIKAVMLREIEGLRSRDGETGHHHSVRDILRPQPQVLNLGELGTKRRLFQFEGSDDRASKKGRR